MAAFVPWLDDVSLPGPPKMRPPRGALRRPLTVELVSPTEDAARGVLPPADNGDFPGEGCGPGDGAGDGLERALEIGGPDGRGPATE